jgi:hypothetical protein
MSRHTIALVAGAVLLGAVFLAGCRAAVNETRALTSWGEPDLAGVWKGEVLGASSGRDTFGLTALEGLYTSDARARMKQLSVKDDPTLQCIPPAFPRAAMLGQRLQIVQKPGFAFVLTEAYPVARQAGGLTPRSSICFPATWATRRRGGRAIRS